MWLPYIGDLVVEEAWAGAAEVLPGLGVAGGGPAGVLPISGLGVPGGGPAGVLPGLGLGVAGGGPARVLPGLFLQILLHNSGAHSMFTASIHNIY